MHFNCFFFENKNTSRFLTARHFPPKFSPYNAGAKRLDQYTGLSVSQFFSYKDLLKSVKNQNKTDFWKLISTAVGLGETGVR